jgi:hypothetical protein
MNNIDDNLGYWFAGLTDGEGCFLIMARKDGGLRYYLPRFSIGLRCDELFLLEEIKRLLCIGHIRRYSRNARRLIGEKTSDICVFDVNGKENQRIVELFHEYPLRSSKQRDFECWAQAVELFSAGNNLALEIYKETLENIRRRKKIESLIPGTENTKPNSITKCIATNTITICPRLPTL